MIAARKDGSTTARAHEQSRVALFVDVPNLWCAAHDQQIENSPTDMMDVARSYGTPVVARAYSTIQAGKMVSSGFGQFQAAGFECVPRIVPEGDNGKKDIDSLLAVEAVSTAYEDMADVFIIASADNDFVPVVRKIRLLGKRVVVLMQQGQHSIQLSSIADETRLLPRRTFSASSPSTLPTTKGAP